jgi:ABC-2 type transport system ATP-binding protein
MNAIELIHASKYFNEIHALEAVSLEVERGEVVAVLGPNGAGKTTAISLMLGLRRPTSGAVRLLGGNPQDTNNRRHVGVMLQDSGVPGMLRVRELIELYGRLSSSPLLLAQVLEMANLSEQANAMAANLSGGQRQRLYFALAVVGDPDVLFLDEPSVGMDVETRHSFWSQIKAFSSAGKTILLTTHYLEEADELAERIVVINQGRVVAQGSPSEIKSRVGGKHVRFHAPNLSSTLLSSLPSVQRFNLLGEVADLYTLDPNHVLKALYDQQIEPADLEVVGAGLEEAFIEITSNHSPQQHGTMA